MDSTVFDLKEHGYFMLFNHGSLTEFKYSSEMYDPTSTRHQFIFRDTIRAEEKYFCSTDIDSNFNYFKFSLAGGAIIASQTNLKSKEITNARLCNLNNILGINRNKNAIFSIEFGEVHYIKTLNKLSILILVSAFTKKGVSIRQGTLLLVIDPKLTNSQQDYQYKFFDGEQLLTSCDEAKEQYIFIGGTDAIREAIAYGINTSSHHSSTEIDYWAIDVATTNPITGSEWATDSAVAMLYSSANDALYTIQMASMEERPEDMGTVEVMLSRTILNGEICKCVKLTDALEGSDVEGGQLGGLIMHDNVPCVIIGNTSVAIDHLLEKKVIN